VTRKQMFALGGVLLIALLLAFALQDVVKAAFVTPLAYLWWAVKLFYSTLPQVALWSGLVILVLVLFIKSLVIQDKPKSFSKKQAKTHQGNIEMLAMEVEKAREGIYNKWKVANRLSRVARDLLIQRGDRESIRVVGPLTGRDWHPSDPVREYLDVGLNGSFADYPNPRWPRRRRQTTPLDLDAGEAVTFLESQMETRSRD